ncbi:hypothetical protein [Alkalicoccobacillus gibsonii]|uniref:hypothetical protein n=1 Tax=Alkalicoccobacillus gibsonii TaxID=79881 RepID=UPI001933D4B0|nr:hypothetical protein [Alkalicoccobacillus gibsonii]MBM0065914.1 hypothetical protein [Alkalicoccobacillus gibsonii]
MYLLTTCTTILSLIYAISLWNILIEMEPVAAPLFSITLISVILSLINKKHKWLLVAINAVLLLIPLLYFFFGYIFFANP